MMRCMRDNFGRMRPIDSSGRFDNSSPIFDRNGYDIRTPYERGEVRLHEIGVRASLRPEFKPMLELLPLPTPVFEPVSRTRSCGCPRLGPHDPWCTGR